MSLAEEQIPPELLFRPHQDNKLMCYVCPKVCLLDDGETGFCGIRKRLGQKIISKTYGLTTGIAVDPIEKKPLYHFLPGTDTLSLGGIGCNMACLHCQNASTSQERREVALKYLDKASPKRAVDEAIDRGLESISLTYNEPTINVEYLVDISKRARKAGIKIIVVTNGFLTKPLAIYLSKYIDAANVDFKGDKQFYRDVCSARQTPVKVTVEEWVKAGVHVELTTLVIPTKNDSKSFLLETVGWIKENLGEDIPLHLSRFYPQYKMNDIPPTSVKMLLDLRKVARKELSYVYTGNIRDEEGGTTLCPTCDAHLVVRGSFNISRRGYGVEFVNFDPATNKCTQCGNEAPFTIR